VPKALHEPAQEKEMLSHLRERATYGNVMATIAVFLVLGGSAFAVVTTKQLGKGSVTTKKLHKGAVTGKKVRKDTLTGKQIKESTLATVPNAAKVNGSTVRQIHYRQVQGGNPVTLFSIAGLTVTASCPAGTEVVVDATTNTNGSIIGLSPPLDGVDDTFNAGEHQIIPLDDYVGVLSYGKGTSGSPVVTATFLANKFNGTTVCSVVGTVIGG
jgi:hypothetical protein